MARGKLNQKASKPQEQYVAVNDLKLQMTLSVLADRYNEAIRSLIYKTYQDDELHSIYKAIRNSGIYQKGGKSKVYRNVIEFPNGYVFDFCDTVMTEMYGEDWLNNPAALRHELVRPWHVVSKL